MSLFSSLLVASAVLAQPPASDPPPAPPDPATDNRPNARNGPPPRAFLDLPPAERRARFREFLKTRMERVERSREALRTAIRDFEDGVPIEKILEDFPPELRPGNGPRGAGGANGGPPGQGGGGPAASDLNELGPVMPAGDEGGGPLGGPRRPGATGRPDGRPGTDLAAGREPRTITDADRRAFDQFLAAAAPNVQTLMAKLREKDPDRADKKLIEALPRVGWLLDLNQREPALFDLRLQDIRHGREALEASQVLARFDREHPDQQSSPERDKEAADANLMAEFPCEALIID